MTELSLTVLCENEASAMPWKAEWGFSVWIAYRGRHILFDTGFSDVWRFNADHAGIDLDKVDWIALSHIHRDHTRGLLHHDFTAKPPLILHPRILQTAPAIEGDDNAAADYLAIQTTLQRDFSLQQTAKPLQFMPGAWFLGEIPRVTGFEKGAYLDDPMPDDTALAFETERGVVVVSGCSHAGICNICQAAMDVTGLPLYAVIGGFHLLHDEDPPVDETIAWFRAESPEILLPMHCVEFDILARFHLELGTQKFGAGSQIDL